MSEYKEIDYLKAIFNEFQKLNKILEKLVNQESKPIKEVEIKETIEQDMTGLTYKTETEKAVLFLKNGFQIWIPKQFIVNKFVKNGNKQDILLSENKKANEWLPKSWEKEKKL